MSAIETHTLVGTQPWKPGPDGQWITHAHVTPHRPFRPFAFYITQNAEAVQLEWLSIANTNVLRGVPGSLLAPGPNDRISEAPSGESSNLGDVAAVTQPGQSIEVELRRSIGSSELEVRMLVVGWTPTTADERAVRRAAREVELAARFLEALITGHAWHKPEDLKPARAFAFELAREFLRDAERLEHVAAELPPGYRRF